MNILAIIPARSGSKSVPHKNIRLMNDKPMLAYSIEHALGSQYINRVILDTDSAEYAEIGKKYGAEIPFLRPASLAEDLSLDFDVFYHCLNYLQENENYKADIVVQLRPTYPIRNIEDIDKMIKILVDNELYDSVRSIAPSKEIPYKMWHRSSDGTISPLLDNIKECYNMPRQNLPVTYYQNACIDVIRGRVILKEKSMSGKHIYGYVMNKNYDIDTEEEFGIAEEFLKVTSGNKKFVFDIDGVIAELQPDNDYEKAQPNVEMIKIVNKLYEIGNEIVLFTARGYVTGIDWEEVTRTQLNAWGLKYHKLLFGKPNADYYIDDKMLNMNRLLEYLR
ncbi:acylneuraminate cytidylyltransferase family protein [Anaerocolumna sp. AGMB13025]|uniref:acylneuraminate cytidylyltransferase family protein n=1 Tax=Anaerocolumna sp. AGMB13025 TaxID=3039116 RepID=UPI00241E73C3|nr:acylneuraminate cytidylyltransferase family protein [Anaerocolumna sp. AGMB13025]WFR56798.1 acylneuraminate cytidylyltransferase family protein [Anaerocolumna sp. AGMB13025]